MSVHNMALPPKKRIKREINAQKTEEDARTRLSFLLAEFSVWVDEHTPIEDIVTMASVVGTYNERHLIKHLVDKYLEDLDRMQNNYYRQCGT